MRWQQFVPSSKFSVRNVIMSSSESEWKFNHVWKVLLLLLCCFWNRRHCVAERWLCDFMEWQHISGFYVLFLLMIASFGDLNLEDLECSKGPGRN